ncbi:hypothetical protein SLA2020_277390 [Shorea laevis]
MGLVSLLILSLFISLSGAEISGKVGVNYGQLGDNLPSPSRSVELIKSLKAKRVKIYDANPDILKALKHTGHSSLHHGAQPAHRHISSNETLADKWVRSNVVPFYREDHDPLPPRRQRNHQLHRHPNLGQSSTCNAQNQKFLKSPWPSRKIKVGTPSAMDVLQSSFPPSNGTFRSDFRVGS